MKQKSFDERCYEILRKVPKGRITTYRAIAKCLGSKAYRAVGNAMNRNPNAPIVPCHRVVKSDGSIGGYAGGPKKKIAMLQREGIPVVGGKVRDLKKFMAKLPK